MARQAQLTLPLPANAVEFAAVIVDPLVSEPPFESQLPLYRQRSPSPLGQFSGNFFHLGIDLIIEGNLVRWMPNQTEVLNAAFHALADPTRRAVVQRLSKGAATVSQLAAPFNMALPSFVQHISVLEKSHLITTHKSGRVRICSLHHANFTAAEKWFEELRTQWASRYENLDNLLKTLHGETDDV